METIVVEQQSGWHVLKISDKYIAVTPQEMGRLNRLSDNGKKLFELPSTELFEAYDLIRLHNGHYVCNGTGSQIYQASLLAPFPVFYT